MEVDKKVRIVEVISFRTACESGVLSWSNPKLLTRFLGIDFLQANCELVRFFMESVDNRVRKSPQLVNWFTEKVICKEGPVLLAIP